MRTTHYLRTPIKLGSLPGLTLSQRPPQRDYGIADSPPQALDLEWDVVGGVMPQVALPWEGLIRFERAPSADLPATQEETTEDNFGSWRLEGALLIEFILSDVALALARDVPILADPPGLVRYEPVRLTQPFLFQSARSSGPTFWSVNGTRLHFEPGAGDATFRRLIFDFLHGRAALFGRHSATDPAADFTENPMPEVSPPSAGTRAKLRVSMAAGSLDALDPSWFEIDPLRDFLGWPPPPASSPPNLVDAAMAPRASGDPRHPIYSPIPPLIVFADAPDAAWVATHGTHPVRNAAIATVAGGVRFRRIDLTRAVVSGADASDEFRRPYPMHQVIVVDPLGARIAARGPLNGRLYLALDDGMHRITAAPRTMSTATAAEGSGVLSFATRPPGAKISTPPANSVTFAVTAASPAYEVFVTALSADGFLVATRLGGSRVGELTISQARTAAQRRYNLEDPAAIAHFPAEAIGHAEVYGIVMDAAFRHGITPEFLQAVMMREGVAARFYATSGGPAPPTPAYDPDTVFRDELGLDTIADNLGHDATKPPVPDIGLQYLIDHGYIDTAIASASDLLNVSHLPPLYLEGAWDHWWADIWHWRAGIEMVAAELQARLDQMYATAGRTAAIYQEDGRQFLSYVRYNGRLTADRWRIIAQEPLGAAANSFIAADGSAKPWDFKIGGVTTWPASNIDPVFTTSDARLRQRLRWVALVMVAAGNYLERLGVFR